MTFPDLSLRPTRPVPDRPAGYLELARFSSLGRLWTLLAGAARAGRVITAVRGDAPEAARRRVAGYTLPGAGPLADFARIKAELDGGFVPHPALVALLAGDRAPLTATLNTGYALHLDFVVALTARRDLIARPEFRFLPLAGAPPEEALSPELPLRARRMPRDTVHHLLHRACGLA